MQKIIIDNIDKRMTAPLVEYFINNGYQVYGIGFEDSAVISNRFSSVFKISKDNLRLELINVFRQFTIDDYLLVGNPLIIEAIDKINPKIKYIIPKQETILKITDKKQLMEFAYRINIKAPKNVSNQYPMIVKLNVSENSNLKPRQRYKIVYNEAEYQKALDSFGDYQGNLLIQEYVKGKGFGVSLLLDYESNLVDYIIHERILEYPTSGGPSVICISRYKKDLIYNAYKLLRELHWSGYAMVEFKGDYLIEINPRYWGSMPLLFIAKSHFFGNYIKILDNDHKKIDINTIPYELNKKMYYFPQAFFAIVSFIKRGNVFQAVKALGHIISSKEGIFTLKNPIPFVHYIKSLLKRGIS